jgi:hypothetical protein
MTHQHARRRGASMRWLLALSLLGAAALAPLSASAQVDSRPQPAPQAQPGPSGQPSGGPELPAADQLAITNYSLNEDVLGRLLAVTKEARAQNIRPQPAPDPAKVRSLDDLANYAVGSDPKLGPLVKKHGFTPREFLLANLALMNAALAVQARTDPNLAKTIDQSKVNTANVAFFESHQQQIAAQMSEGAK